MGAPILFGFSGEQIFVALWILLSLGVAAIKHPGDREGTWAMFVELLGRVSLLRHSDSPGTLHPGMILAKQPAPLDPGEVVGLETQIAAAVAVMETQIAAALAGLPINPAVETPVEAAARLLRTLPRPTQPALLLMALASLLGGCLTPAKVMFDLGTMDRLSAKAETNRAQCLLREPVGQCQTVNQCLNSTSQASYYGARAIADAATTDPWMRGPNSTAFKRAVPVATTVCSAAGVSQQ